MDLFFFQLVIIFIPGIVWERIDAQFGPNRAVQQWDILRRSFIYGLAAYIITFGLYSVAGLIWKDVSFKLFELQRDRAFLDREAFKQIFVTSGVALLCGILWLYPSNYKWITWFMHRIGATKRYGDEDVWDYAFNSPRAEVEYIHIRDFDKKITYAGWVEIFSETEKLRELVLRDVIAYDFEGKKLFETPRVYLARKMDNIDIEFPYRADVNPGVSA